MLYRFLVNLYKIKKIEIFILQLNRFIIYIYNELINLAWKVNRFLEYKFMKYIGK